MKWNYLVSSLLFGFALPWLLFFTLPDAAATGVVGDGSAESCTEAALDAALSEGGNITFDCGTAPYTITLGEKTITQSTSLLGDGLLALVGGASRLFTVTAGVSLTLADLTLQGGNVWCSLRSGRGGAVYNVGTLVAHNVTFKENRVRACGDVGAEPGLGGAIYNAGRATITDSRFEHNVVDGRGEPSTMRATSPSPTA